VRPGDLLGSDGDDGCGCEPSFDGAVLVVDADGCDGAGDLVEAHECRATVVDALATRDAEAVLTRADGTERAYEGRAAALLVAAGRFAERAAGHDPALAERARGDPLGAARAATARAGAVADVAAETGLAECARGVESDADALRPHVAPALTHARVAVRPPPDAVFDDRRTLETDAVVRIYHREAAALRTYHVVPVECDLDRPAASALAEAHALLAGGAVSGGERAAGRAVRRVVDDAVLADRLAAVLRKHTSGEGVLEDLFTDDRVSDVYATAPVERNPLRVVVDGETMRSNVRLGRDGAGALASRFRRESGRAFSRASPALAATTEVGDRAVRVAGVTEPTSDGVSFAFRARDRRAWTLPALVDNGTLPPPAAGLLSVAVQRGAAVLVAGGRGAGKTTTLGALLWELSPSTRVVCIEDTRELPVERLQRHGRDVQALRATDGDEAGLDAAGALRTALRLGEGAIVVGEVRGEEARVLYEAMRVGAGSGAVLGTVHGDGAAELRERVVEDLGVPASSFASTDLVVTCERTEDDRRVAAVDEVVDAETFAPLFGLEEGGLAASGRVDRGESTLVADLAASDDTYGEVREAIQQRATALERAAAADLTRPGDVADGYAPPAAVAHRDRRG
jgi:flagellar protein FlaI